MDWLTLTLLVFVVAALPLHAADVERSGEGVAAALTIRTYLVRERDEPSAAALVLAASLLRDAGIRSRWVSCRPALADATCTLPLTPTDLAMRLIHDQVNTVLHGAVPMGTSFVDTTRRTGALATIYLDRIDSLAAATGTRADVILARAIAHEAAHLVLGTNEHGPRGLMRALWSRAMLRNDAASAWVFTPDERRKLSQAMVARVVSVPPSPSPTTTTH